MKIILNDGQSVEVDDDRYAVFNQYADSLGSILMAGGNPFVGDAVEVMSFLVGQLTYTEQKVFERQYLAMQYEQLVPISYEAGEWAENIRYEITDWAGRGKRLNSRGKDIPKVDVAIADKTFPVVNGGIGYDYTTEELRRTAYLRRPINASKLMAAMEAYRRHLNQVALYGELNLTGLFNSTVIPQGNAPTGTWGTATPDQILADINAIILNVWTNTAYNDTPTHIILPPGAMSKISSTARSTTSDTTILKYLQDNNIAKQQKGVNIQFEVGFGLDTAGSGGTRRMMAYVKDENRLVFHVPLPLRFLAPQLSAYLVEVPGEYKYSGVEFRMPKSAYYMDGV